MNCYEANQAHLQGLEIEMRPSNGLDDDSKWEPANFGMPLRNLCIYEFRKKPPLPTGPVETTCKRCLDLEAALGEKAREMQTTIGIIKAENEKLKSEVAKATQDAMRCNQETMELRQKINKFSAECL